MHNHVGYTFEDGFIMSKQHENYQILNLIGYGLAKFDTDFVKYFGFVTKKDFYEYCIEIKIAETIGVVKNRQDLFDPFFDNNRKGWWQKGDTYIHRKEFIESVFEHEVKNVEMFSSLVKLYLESNFPLHKSPKQSVRPILKSKFRHLQETGKEAEMFFINNYSQIEIFRKGQIEDARLFGDGYDFQINVNEHFFLAEIKGLRENKGSVRFTKNEFLKANEYRNDYILVVVNGLDQTPRMDVVRSPAQKIDFSQQTITKQQITFNSKSLDWSNL